MQKGRETKRRRKIDACINEGEEGEKGMKRKKKQKN